jgi:Tfp pilus assembly protein PilF
MGTSQFWKLAGRLFLCFLLCACVSARALGSEKENPSLSHYIMAVMYERLGELEKAVEEYKKALKTDQDNPAIHLGLAAAFIKSGKLQEATPELNLAVSLEPEAVEPHAMLALLNILDNKLELATREYEIALKNASKLEPENIDIYKSLALVYLQQKRYPEAKGIYDLIIGLVPGDPEAHF